MNNNRFQVTEQHLKLIQHMWIDFYAYAYDGAPAVDIKRPYGNSDVCADIAEILGIEYDCESCDEEKDVELLTLHKETATALQIRCKTQSFKTGTYIKSDLYGNDWVAVEESQE